MDAEKTDESCVCEIWSVTLKKKTQTQGVLEQGNEGNIWICDEHWRG
jgi:hypothetical protein